MVTKDPLKLQHY